MFSTCVTTCPTMLSQKINWTLCLFSWVIMLEMLVIVFCSHDLKYVAIIKLINYIPTLRNFQESRLWQLAVVFLIAEKNFKTLSDEIRHLLLLTVCLHWYTFTESFASPHSFLRETFYMCFRVRTISASLTFCITVYEGNVLFKLCTGHNFMAHLDPWSYEQQHFENKTLIRMKNCCDLCLFKCALSGDRDRFTCLFESRLRQQCLCKQWSTHSL